MSYKIMHENKDYTHFVVYTSPDNTSPPKIESGWENRSDACDQWADLEASGTKSWVWTRQACKARGCDPSEPASWYTNGK